MGSFLQASDVHGQDPVDRPRESAGTTVAYAVHPLGGVYSELYGQVWFKTISRSTTANLFRFQTASGGECPDVIHQLHRQPDARTMSARPTYGAPPSSLPVGGIRCRSTSWSVGHRVAQTFGTTGRRCLLCRRPLTSVPPGSVDSCSATTPTRGPTRSCSTTSPLAPRP